MNNRSRARSVVIAILSVMVCASRRAEAVTIGAAVPKQPVNVFYIDPVNGTMNGDGSQARPWSTLAAVLSAKLVNGQDRSSGVVHAGDLIYLMTGNHGDIHIDPWYYGGKVANTDFITIQAAPNNKPVINSLEFQNASYWAFRGLTIQNPPGYTKRGYLASFSTVNNILFDSNVLYSVPNAVSWTPSDWATSSSYYGIYMDAATSCTFSNNSISNVENGAYLGGNGILFTGNTIDYFASDGIDFSSSNSIISQNIVSNHYGKWNDGLHHDGMQGWTEWNQTSTTNVVIDRNMVMASTGVYPTIPLVPTGIGDDYLQGISIFDGVWSNLTVTNNVVGAAGVYHGMSLYGMSNTTIENNTVISQGGNNQTWIGVFNSSTGVAPVKVVVRNNIGNSFVTNAKTGVVFDHNLSFVSDGLPVDANIPVVDPLKVFVKYSPATASFDFHLRSGSPAIGTGSSSGAPKYDFTGKARNSSKIDIGAYAY
jgi:parallel beta-helix repeat protein